MNTAPLDQRLGKADAVMELSRRIGLEGANGWDASSVPSTLKDIEAVLPPLCNEEVSIATAEQLGLKWLPIHAAASRSLAPIIFINGQPDCFRAGKVINALSPEFKVLSVPNGYIGHFFGAALIAPSEGRSVVQDVSSRYSGLYQYYDFDFAKSIKHAKFIDGTVIPIADDIRPLNFCHWLVDWLPRLEFLGPNAYRPNTYVVTTPIIARFQRDSLRMCGFDESRIIALEDFHVVQARELLVPSDLRVIPHPSSKGAPWALSYLRSTVGIQSLFEAGTGARRKERLYVSRADAPRRQIVNDTELADALAKFGYRSIELSGLSIAEQVANFASASHIVSLHGAGLSNLAFVAQGTNVIEIFPTRYGTPAFAIIASSVGCTYATYVADSAIPGVNLQADNVEINVARFIDACSHLL